MDYPLLEQNPLVQYPDDFVPELILNQNGWTAKIKTVARGTTDQVLQIYDWIGGILPFTKPGTGYISSTGLVQDISLATNVRGAPFGPVLTSDLSNLLIVRIGDTLCNFIDQYTHEMVTFTKSADTTADGIIVIHIGAEFFRRNFTGAVNVKWFGAKGNNTGNDAPYIQNAINTRLDVFIPPGQFRLTTSVILAENNFTGSGTNETSFYVDAAVNAFVIANGTFQSRNSVVVGNFAVMSPNSTCNNNYAFYAGGWVTSPALVYNVGLTVQDVEIGGNGVFGGGLFISSFFRVNLSRIGMSSVRNPISLIGSVVQVTLDSITSNGDAIPSVSTLTNTGLYIESKNYNEGPFGTESLKTRAVSLVANDTGVNYSGTLFTSFTGLDLDYCVSYGVIMNSPGIVENCYIASSNTTGTFIGILVGVPNNVDPLLTTIRSNIINAYVPLGAGSTAIQYGSGGVTPFLETLGGVIEDNSIQCPGINGFTTGINSDRTKGVRIVGNRFKNGTVTGTEIIATNAKRATITDNIIPNGTIIVDSPVGAFCTGVVTGNTATIQIGPGGIAVPSQWFINFNDQDANNIKSGGDNLETVIDNGASFFNAKASWVYNTGVTSLVAAANEGLSFFTNAGVHQVLKLLTDGRAIFENSIQTGVVTTGDTPADLKFGNYTAGVPSGTGYLKISIGGTVYKLLAST